MPLPASPVRVRSKTLIAVCIAALILMSGIFALARSALLRSFGHIEDDTTRQCIERVRRSLEQELAHLAAAAERGAVRDDSYFAVLARTPRYAALGLTPEALDGVGADLIWIIDTDGHTLAALQIEGDGAERWAQLAPQELAQLQRHVSEIDGAGERSALARLLAMPRGVLAFATAPVLKSDHTGPRAGTLLIGRYLSKGVARELSQATQLPVAITALGSTAETLRLPEEVRRWLSSAPQAAEPFMQLRDTAMLNGYTLLRDVRGQPLAVLSTGVRRDALTLGRQRMITVIIAVTAGFGGIVLALLVLVSRSWGAIERQRRAHRRRLVRLANRDAITGLPNRAQLQARLPKLLAEAERTGSLLALLYVDLDHFKDVNDSLGHSSGDRLLATVAQRLRRCVARGDLVARMGADEFVVIATGLPAASAVDYIARRIQETLTAPLELDGLRLGMLASIGISLYPSDGANLEQLLKHADIALHQAKRRGRANHQFFTGEMQTRLADRLELEHALRHALTDEQLFLEYQPAFDLQTRAPVGFEALVRWNHPQLGLVPPGRFVPIAEHDNLILELGAWVLRHVCRQLAEWQQQGLMLLPVSINVTPRQFEHGRLVELVAGLTREFGIDAHWLHFEITESAAMQNSAQHLGALQALRNLGCRILIDDFGTGYSSLSYLKHLPIDTLKIDRAFVRDMASDTNDAAIVSAIIGIANSLGLHVVAEGVETAEQLACLTQLGCRTAQGFYFSRPLPAAEARVVLEKLGSRRRSGDTAKLVILKS